MHVDQAMFDQQGRVPDRMALNAGIDHIDRPFLALPAQALLQQTGEGFDVAPRIGSRDGGSARHGKPQLAARQLAIQFGTTQPQRIGFELHARLRRRDSMVGTVGTHMPTLVENHRSAARQQSRSAAASLQVRPQLHGAL
ncbi:hypothetical protein, partial [Pseudoduganella sp. RAF53_2]|uniref:hypothetical protein n=1 Tax=Pseudoduganella sp. RAF53_2 TaxID=3233060 RepID=UPI003F9D9E6E